MKRNSRGSSKIKPVVIGTGLVALDVVIADSVDADPILCAGGSCGNVLTCLAFLGWNAYPIARLRSDAASKRVIDDLQYWGVKTDFVTLSDSGSTPVVVQHIRLNSKGERSHTFSRRCPSCGNWLPWYKAVRNEAIADLAPRLPRADVFYFDRTSRAAITLAEKARKSGSLIVFEPSAESEKVQLVEALQVAHIVKVASDRIRDNESLRSATEPNLIVETLGSEGLRYLRGSGKRRTWKSLPAFKVSEFRDAAGAGDWCTAGIISILGPLGPAGVEAATDSEVRAAIRRGQAMAAWTCRYEGARGGMYAATKVGFDRAIGDILDGKASTTANKPRLKVSTPVAAGTPWCSCGGTA